jgi:hypothetical protein
MNTENELAIMPTAKLMSLLEALFERFLNQGKVPYSSLSGDPQKVYSRKQIAEILGRSENTVTKYIKQRKLVATRLNGIYYISQTSLHNFINNTKNAKS